MEVFVKKGETRIDPKKPESTDSNWKRRYEKGQERLKSGTLKWENETEQRDYMKAVGSNPANVPGLPVFFPPLTIRSFISMDNASRKCSTEGCEGCCIAIDNYMCPRCGKQN